MSGIYDFTAQSLAGEEVPLKRFEGQVLLIVNTASACGFTPQYRGLQAAASGAVAARLCGARLSLQPVRRAGAGRRQRRSSEFCDQQVRHYVSDVCQDRRQRQPPRHPLYNYLKSAKSGLLGPSIKWNFTKFLVDRSGQGGGAARPDRTARRTAEEKSRRCYERRKRRPTTDRVSGPPLGRPEQPVLQRRSSCARRRHPLQGRRERPMSRNTASAKAGYASPPAMPRTATATR